MQKQTKVLLTIIAVLWLVPSITNAQNQMSGIPLVSKVKPLMGAKKDYVVQMLKKYGYTLLSASDAYLKEDCSPSDCAMFKYVTDMGNGYMKILYDPSTHCAILIQWDVPLLVIPISVLRQDAEKAGFALTTDGKQIDFASHLRLIAEPYGSSEVQLTLTHQ